MGIMTPRSEVITVAVGPQHAGERLDRILTQLIPELSRAAASELIEQGLVLVQGRLCKPATRPVAGARIKVTIPPKAGSDATAEDIPLTVVYEDDDLAVIDKPAGMVVHPAPGNETGTLVNALLGRYARLPGEQSRPGIVHRLDKDTSGLMVVARSAGAAATLSHAFKHREVHKEYLALVTGHMRQQSGVIRADIGRDPRHRQRMAVVATGGRDARTTFHTEEVFKHFSLIRVELETGRMHQIRVHFSAIGHPVVGDPVYGRSIRGVTLKRQFLHSAILRFRHPITGEDLQFESPLPAALADLLQRLREAEGLPVTD